MNEAQKELKRRIEKIRLKPGDIVIVRNEEDMRTLLEMTQAGIGFSEYANPVLFLPGGLEKATREDLIDALKIIDQTMNVSKIISSVN